MATKKNFNFALPEHLAETFEETAERFGAKRRWMICSAAILRLLELPPDELDLLAQRVLGADMLPGGMEKLIAEAQAKSAATGHRQDPALVRAGRLHLAARAGGSPARASRGGSKGR